MYNPKEGICTLFHETLLAGSARKMRARWRSERRENETDQAVYQGNVSQYKEYRSEVVAGRRRRHGCQTARRTETLGFKDFRYFRP